MKIDFLSCSKMLYFAEKIRRDSYYILPDIGEVNDDFAKKFDMTVAEVEEIQKQFVHDKLFVMDNVPTEIEDDFGEMESEMSYDALTVNKKRVDKYIQYLKKRYGLRSKPFVSREAVVSIAKEIEAVLGKEGMLRVVEGLPSNFVAWQLRAGKYTLADLLFRHSCADQNDRVITIESLAPVLAEFLNPIYYDMQRHHSIQNLYKYIDEILHVHADAEDYRSWKKEAEKYIAPRLLDVKGSKSHSESEVLDNTFIENEKEKSRAITIPTDHRQLRDQWLNIKRILDVLYKRLPPLSAASKIPFSVDLSGFPKHYVEDVLQFLLDKKVVSYFDPNKNTGITTTTYLRQFLEGKNIVIQNREGFEKYRNRLSALNAFIESDGKNRFPSVYGLPQPMESDSVKSASTLNIKRSGLLKIKRILDCIANSREISVKGANDYVIALTTFLSASRGLIKSKNEVDSILYKVRDEGGGIQIERAWDRDEIDSKTSYIITLTDSAAFNSYHKKVLTEYNSIEPAYQESKNGNAKSSAQSVPFFYNPETGDGTLRGNATKRLTDGTPGKRLFDEVYKNRGRKVERSVVIQVLSLENEKENVGVEPTKLLSALGDSSKHRKDGKVVQNTNKINGVVKEIRKKFGFNIKEFVNNGGNITLTI